MINQTAIGRPLLALALVAFGIQHFLYAQRNSGLGPPFTPENHPLAWLAGILLIAAAVGLAVGKHARLAALAVGVLFLLRGALYYLPQVALTPRDPRPWTSAFELLAISGATFCLFAAHVDEQRHSRALRNARGPVFQMGRFLFIAALTVFGAQHLLYGPFIAALITSWIPGHLFWAYFVGVAFLSAAVAILIEKLSSMAVTLLGVMFLLWVLVLHAPRVAGAPSNANEWTSLLVALAMSGCSFILAGLLQRRIELQ